MPAGAPARLRLTSRLHPVLDDLQAVATGALLGALAMLVFREAGLVPGGTIGLALLLHAATGHDPSLLLLAANAPFYLLAVVGLGAGFTGRTVPAVLATALLTELLPHGLSVSVGSPLLAAVVGGLLCGLAMLVLFRHGSSLGGLNILVLWLQRRFGWPPARIQLLLDAAIVCTGAWLSADLRRTTASLAAVATLNLVLALNHRPAAAAPGEGRIA
mgnify:FL=1